jgi:hypothetical protein
MMNDVQEVNNCVDIFIFKYEEDTGSWDIGENISEKNIWNQQIC